jgi:CubicO group peptidase (beta-lactamase class C family)
MAKIQSAAIGALQKVLDDATSGDDAVPGLIFAATNRDGDIIFEHASGKIGAGRSEPMTTDNVVWIASCTKMITGVACMQLVEQGTLELDDVELVERLAPELKAVKVLQEDGSLKDKEKGITLRMLLSHTGKYLLQVQSSSKKVTFYFPCPSLPS